MIPGDPAVLTANFTAVLLVWDLSGRAIAAGRVMQETAFSTYPTPIPPQ